MPRDRSDASLDTAGRRQPRWFRMLAAGTLGAFALMLVLLVIFGLRFSEEAAQAEHRVEHTLQVLDESTRLLSAVQDAETGERGYLLTSAPLELQPYEAGLDAVRERLAALRRLTLGKAAQQMRLGALEEAITARLEHLALALRLARSGDSAVALELVREGPGRQHMRTIRSLIQEFRSEEEKLLWARQAEAADAYGRVRGNLALGAGTALLVLLAGAAGLVILVRRQETAERAARIAEALARQRGEILAVMAHEIHTPMTAVLGFGELLATAGLPPEQHRQAEAVVESGRVMLAVLNDILDLARMEAGHVGLEVKPFPLVGTLRQAQAQARALAAEKSLDLVLELGEGLPPWLLGDATRIRQVLGNLLGNAVKFTERGRVTLRARWTAAGKAGHSWLRLEVEDTGIGIPESAQPRLFEMFERGAQPGGRRVGGTGLGLAICRRLVAAMGGDIGLWSEEGRGSLFWCELPLPRAEAPPAQPAPQNPSAAGALDLLVVDDVAANRALIHAYLQGAGHRVTLAEDGAQAVIAAGLERFDLIVMDVNMPVLDGLEATRRIRAGSGPNACTPIIALTAGTAAEDRARTQAAGMAAHLAKPVGRTTLLEAISRLAGARPLPEVASYSAPQSGRDRDMP